MVGAIILAAGSSSRLGQSKQLLKIENETLLERVIRTVKASMVDHAIVVLGSNYQTHLNALRGTEIETTYNAEWQQGMGSSIKAGLEYLLERHPETSSIIIVTCDQVTLTSQHLNQLIQKHHQVSDSIVASEYDNSVGVPVLFGKNHFNSLLSIEPGEGAKSIITQHRKAVSSIFFQGGSIDIDTMEDYLNFTTNFS